MGTYKKYPLMTRVVNQIKRFFKVPGTYRGEVIKRIIINQRYMKYVEVGVWTGEVAEYLAYKCCFLEKLYLVDPYLADTDFKGGSMYKKGDIKIVETAKHWAHHRLDHDERIKFIKKKSVDAAKEFEDESVDVVFIDGMHDYENVKQDITSWLPKIRKGGIMLGDDYAYNTEKVGVVKAVNKIFNKKDIKLLEAGIWSVRV